ncbi:MAG TPA: sulfatase [Candidatus Lokiarchaeia archaeon]|nr:sulfatase [Candidatus Lokiarchaeia archaeon]
MSEPAIEKKPNIILILIDDLGWADLDCYGSTFYETPNISRLAREGMLFTNAYAACPVCSPTRASLLTGKFPARVGITNYIPGQEQGKLLSAPYLHYLPFEEKSIARALKDGGYRTYSVGKWHLGAEPYWPEHHGFDVNIGGCDWGNMKHGYFSPYGNPAITDGPPGEYITDRLTDEAIDLIKNNGDAPFFLYLAHYAVHLPIQVAAKYQEKYEKKAKALGLDKLQAFEDGEPFPTREKRNQRVRRRLIQSDPAYAGMIENLDENIGRLLDTLDELGIANNTVVIFTSDNGGLSTAESSPTCNFPLSEGKGWIYEGGCRVSLIARWPEIIPEGSTCNAYVNSPDFYPTLLEMAGLPLIPEQHVDGSSFLPLLQGNPSPEQAPTFWHYPHYGNQGGTPASSVRDGDYKLIEFFEDGRVELFNLRDDISETHDISNDEPETTARLEVMLAAWRNDVNAKIPEQNPDWPYYFFDHFIHVVQDFVIDDNGQPCLKMPLSPQNPQIIDVPVGEFLEYFLDKPAVIKVGHEMRKGMLHLDADETLVIIDTPGSIVMNIGDMLAALEVTCVDVKAWKLTDDERGNDPDVLYGVTILPVEDPTI